MQKLSETPDRTTHAQEKEPSRQKKETCSLSAVTGEVSTVKSFLLLVEGPTCPFLCCTLFNFSTSRNKPRLKTPYKMDSSKPQQLKIPNN